MDKTEQRELIATKVEPLNSRAASQDSGNAAGRSTSAMPPSSRTLAGSAALVKPRQDQLRRTSERDESERT